MPLGGRARCWEILVMAKMVADSGVAGSWGMSDVRLVEWKQARRFPNFPGISASRDSPEEWWATDVRFLTGPQKHFILASGGWRVSTLFTDWIELHYG